MARHNKNVELGQEARIEVVMKPGDHETFVPKFDFRN